MKIPYNASRAWTPEESLLVLGVFLPRKWDQISNLETYLGLLADRVQYMIDQEYPEGVEEALRFLEEADLLAGLTWPLSRPPSQKAGQEIIHRMQMEIWLVSGHDLSRRLFPVDLKTAQTSPAQELAEIRLAEWADTLTRGNL